MIPRFETKRLILRAPTPRDFSSWRENFVDYEVVRFLSHHVPWPYPADGVETFFKNTMEKSTRVNVGSGAFF